MGRFVSATGQFLLATYGQFSRPPTGSFSCPLTQGWPSGRRPKSGSGSPSCPTGFATATDPAALQAICDRLGPRADPGVRRTLVVAPAAAADPARPRRRVLMGAVDAPGGDLTHPGVSAP